MINLGIVIAVSDYTADARPLPACQHDGSAIAHILADSGRFQDVLRIETGTTAPLVKQKLSDFTKKYAGKEIGEVLFYFTGHGEFIDDEFYYLLSDYQARRRKQTSLENNELDGLIRALSPDIFIKIVDACHSGVSYIKSSDDFKDYLKSANQNFQKLYFMFSSQSEQFSYQNDKISYFTESIVKSIYHQGSEKIRYKDVISFVSDDFSGRGVQTPLFVTQADFTEIFCDVTTQLKERLLPYIQEDADLDSALVGESDKRITLVDRIRGEAHAFCSKEEAINSIEYLKSLAISFHLSGDLADIYKVEIAVEESAHQKAAPIGNWLENSSGDINYFAKPKRERETFKKRVPKNSLLSRVSAAYSLLSDEDFHYIDATREVISGFFFTTDMPFNYLKIRLESAFPNVSPEECYIVPIVSRTSLRLFWAFSHFEYVDWDRAKSIGKIEWSTNEVPLKDRVAIHALFDQIGEGFCSFVEEPLKATFGTEPPANLVDDSTES